MLLVFEFFKVVFPPLVALINRSGGEDLRTDSQTPGLSVVNEHQAQHPEVPAAFHVQPHLYVAVNPKIVLKFGRLQNNPVVSHRGRLCSQQVTVPAPVMVTIVLEISGFEEIAEDLRLPGS